MHDLVIRGGQVFDGAGADPIMADIAIDGDKITAIGGISAAQAHCGALCDASFPTTLIQHWGRQAAPA
jgi:N-acyl-D-aspartate/D-glutamate deacylase